MNINLRQWSVSSKVILLSVFIYIVSLFTGVTTPNSGGGSQGIGLWYLLFGWLDIFDSGNLAWFANVFYFFSLFTLFHRKFTPTLVLIYIASLFVVVGLADVYQRNDAGAGITLWIGFYCWAASMLIVGFYSLYHFIRS